MRAVAPTTLTSLHRNDMSLFQKRPGEILFLAFVIGGLTLTAAVTVAESLSGLAGNGFGKGFDGGMVDGSSWAGEQNR